MNCCLLLDNRRTYLIDVIFVAMLSDFVFSGDVPLFFRNGIMNYRSEILGFLPERVLNCNFFLVCTLFDVTDEF